MENFWETKTLHQLTEDEWESLCDDCGRCCLQKLEDEDSGHVLYTQLVCHLYDMDKCACSDYTNRHARVSNCVKLDISRTKQFHWLPSTCAYRLIYEGKKLFKWHPLLSGSKTSLEKAGISIDGMVVLV